jgi:hypothetical protein
MFPKIYKILLLILFTCSFTFSQTGRISGKVVDQQTGEPLIGANIIIVGTSLGAASDVNGEYLITNVSAGEYSVRASFIGYQDATVNKLIVNTGLTTRLNFELQSTEFSTQEVVIVSQRPLIEKTSTNAKRIIGTEDFEVLGRYLNAIVSLQPGVVRQNDVIYIRGSRPDETGYTVEGADVKDILNRNGGSLVNVTSDALQEIIVQAGGYTAEFGNANAGIISSEFKTGTNQYHASLRVETDNFGNYPGDKFLGTHSFGYSDYTLTLSGPVYTDKLKVFLSGENLFRRDDSKFFEGNPIAFSDGARLDTTKVFDTGFYGGSKSEYQYLTWDPANIPGNSNNRYTLNGTVVFDNNPLILRLAGAFSWSRNKGTNNIINLFNTERLPVTDNSSLLLNLKGTYLLGANSFIDGSFGFLDSRQKIYDPFFKDDILAYSDSLAASKYGWKFDNYITSPARYDFYGFPFNRPGALLTGYTKDHNNYLSGSVAYTGQIEKHAIKIGGSFQRWTVRRYQQLDPSNFLSTVRNNPDAARDSLAALIGSTAFANLNNYGFDVFGNETDETGLFAPKHPIFASGYLVDRIEVNDLIINAGLRYDYIDMDSWAWKDPSLPIIDRTTHLIPDSALTEGSTFSYISPRIGFAFPVTDRTVFHLQYGKFVQSPSLDVAYRGVYQASRQIQAANLFTSPIAYNPSPIRTTQYEIGFSHQFTDFAAFDITAFYKDIKGQLQYAVVNTSPGALRSKYNVFANQDFATTKGLELSFKIRRIERISAIIYYTYSTSEGTNSLSGSGLGSTEVNGEVPTVLIPLDYDQTHRGSISLDYRFDKGDGGPILEQLGLNILLTFNSGHPFTYSQTTGLGQSSAWTGGITPIGTGDTRGRRPIGPINSSVTPWVYNIDVRIDKTVNLFNFDFNFYVAIQNLLNTKNVINVYDKTGNAFNDGFLDSKDGQQIIAGARYTERFADLYRAINYGNRQAAYSVYGYDLFGPPRQMRAGILVNF